MASFAMRWLKLQNSVGQRKTENNRKHGVLGGWSELKTIHSALHAAMGPWYRSALRTNILLLEVNKYLLVKDNRLIKK